jgi:TolA-binding protein
MKRLLAATAALLVSGSLAFAQTGGVRGKILDDKGQPIDGVQVKIEFQGGVNLVFEGKTNKKGEFMQIGLRPGTWKFSYAKDGFSPFVSPYRISLGGATVLPDVKLLPLGAGGAGGTAEDIQKGFASAVDKLQAGDFDGAIAGFDELILKNPTLSEAYYNKGFAQFQKKDYPAAEVSLKRALEVKADYGDARVLLSNIYTAQGNKDKAVEVMSSSAAGGDPRQLFNLALVLLNSGKSEEATETFLKVEAADPSHSEVQYYLATAALQAGKTDECVSRLEKYLALGPKSDQNKATADGLLAALKKK